MAEGSTQRRKCRTRERPEPWQATADATDPHCVEGPKRGNMTATHWKDEPESHDFPAAHDYLSLVLDEKGASRLVEKLKSVAGAGGVTRRKAKDLLRASQLALLESSNAHVASDLEKVAKGEKLSPVLVVAGDAFEGRPLIIADGYHRVCASYWIDENTDIPCVIARIKAQHQH